MTGYIKVEESFVEALIKNAAWDSARVSLVEAAEKKVDAMKEEVEEHICPLCESVLDEALTDEQIDEHVAQIYDALNTIEEAEEAEEAEDDDKEKAKGRPKAKKRGEFSTKKVVARVDKTGAGVGKGGRVRYGWERPW